MEHLPDTIEPERDMNEAMISAAKSYLKLGYSPIPLVGGTKKAAIKWKPFQDRPPTEDELLGWFSTGEPNVALVTGNGVVVVDVDDPRLLDEVLERCGETPMRCATPTPGHTHLYYRMRASVHYGNAVQTNGRHLDLRCEGGYAVAPWSRNPAGVPYRWLSEVLPASELPLLKVKWLRERTKPKPIRIEDPTGRVVTRTGGKVRNILNPEGYCMRIESVQGQNGSAALVRTVCILRDAGRSPQQALDFLLLWNETNCFPPWSETELAHAVRRHFGIK